MKLCSSRDTKIWIKWLTTLPPSLHYSQGLAGYALRVKVMGELSPPDLGKVADGNVDPIRGPDGAYKRWIPGEK